MDWAEYYNKYRPYYTDTEELMETDNINNAESTQLPNLPDEIIKEHIIPLCPIEWLNVSKKCNMIAFPQLLADPRLNQKMTRTPAVAITRAVREKSIHGVQLLLSDPRTNLNTFSTIDDAIENGNYCIIKLLAESSKTRVRDLLAIMAWAGEKGHVQLFKALLEDERLRNIPHECKALNAAIRGGNVILVQYLLEKFPEETTTAFVYAVERGNYSLVEMLLQKYGVNPCGLYNYPLRFAVRRGYYEIVQLLLSYPQVDPIDETSFELIGVDMIDRDNPLGSAIVEAFKSMNTVMIQLLLKDSKITLNEDLKNQFQYLLPTSK